MTKMKATKRALLSSALALFLCCAMLIGTTFAWFTDSVTSANNIIKSGNLDITLEYWNGTEWVDVEGKSDILTNTLWEPGVTEVAYFRIKNAGSLALKYQFGVNIVSETAGINAAGESFKLSDYIYFDMVEGQEPEFADRDAAMAYATEETKISAGYAKADTLLAESDYVYLAMVVYMPTTVGNEANHNGINVPQIDLGINIMATQVASEEDSFDKYYDGATEWYGGYDYSWYDENATELTVGTAEQLAALATLVNGTATQATMYANVATGAEATVQDSFEGVTITLASDIDLKNIPWTPIGNWDNAFEGTFDGNGYTIRNLYINDPKGEGVGFFGVAANATIKGVTFENVDINGYSMVATVAGAAYPSIISDCHVTGDINIVAEWAYVAGVSGYNYYGTQVSDCSVIADADDMGTITSKTRNGVGGITAWLLEGDHKVTNCDVENLNLTGWTNIGAITGFVHYSNTIADCSVENVVITKTRADGNPGVGLIAGGYSYNANNAIILKNNIINGVELNGNHIAYSTYNNLYGSEYGGATAANFVLENNKTENITNNLVEVNKIGDGIVETNDGTKMIYNANGLKSLSGQKISGTYELIADLDMSGVAMKPMEISGGANVTFIGNGHTISNLTLGAAGIHGMTGAGNEVAGLFDLTAPATTVSLIVSDLAFENATIACSGYAAVVAGYNSNKDTSITLNNVDVKGATVTSDTVAALVGYTTGVVTLTDCDVSGLALTGEAGRPDKVGALVGTANTATCTVNVNNCTNATSYSDYGRVINGATWKGVIGVNTAEGFQNALDNATDGTTIALRADITGNVKVTQKPNVKITIDGNNKTFAGVITVDGKSATYTTAGLTIKNVNFKADSISADACIRLGDGTNATRYTCNVTVDGCTFDVPGAVGVKSYTGGDKNLTIKNSTATANAHSLVQAKGIDGILVEKCVVNSKNGLNFNNSDNVTVDGCTVDVKGYAVRFGEGSAEDNNAETYLVENCSLKSANDDGDATIVLRGTAAKAILTIKNTTIVGTPDIANNAIGATIVK